MRESVHENLPKEYWAHTTESIDFAPLAGKRVAVIGAGASAFDYAATALEAGAAGVDLFFRRPELPSGEPIPCSEARASSATSAISPMRTAGASCGGCWRCRCRRR